MYQYNYADQTLVEERVAQFRDQTERFWQVSCQKSSFATAVAKRPVHPALCADVAYRHSLRFACQLPVAQIGRDYSQV